VSKKTTEELYNEIYKQAEDKDMFEEIKYDGFDNHLNRDKKETENSSNWKERVSEAGQIARKQGNLPNGMERLIEEMLEPKINWKKLLYRYITNEVISDYRWDRNSRKGRALGFYLPSAKKENLEITCFVDVSGSISDEELSEFLGELLSIKNSFEMLKVNLVFWDTKMQNHYEMDNSNFNEISNLKITGRGGTSFRNVYDYIKKEIPKTKILIFFTDAFADYPKKQLYKTLWIVTKNGDENQIPYGEVIKL
jgi:predicted metal-dependent peptidase